MKTILGLAAALACAGAEAYDWSQHSAGETVSLPAGTYEVTDADMDTINSFAGINLADAGAAIVFDVTGECSLACSVTNLGMIVKRGAGTLTTLWPAEPLDLPFIESMANWFTEGGLRIEEGTFKLPQDVPQAGGSGKLGDVFISEGACLYLAKKVDGKGCNTQLVSLFGAGDVVFDATTTGQFGIGNYDKKKSPQYCKPSEFSGRLIGDKMRYQSGGDVMLTGTASEGLLTDGFAVHNKGTTGLMKIGKDSTETSSMGNGMELAYRENGSSYLYLGKGETTAKNMTVWYSPAVFDAGEFGGVTFTGNWGTIFDNVRKDVSKYFVLDGANAEPCVIEGGVVPTVFGGVADTLSFVKRGPGTWRLASTGANRGGLGLVAVEEGTLQYDDVAEADKACSFGTSEVRYERGYSGVHKDEKLVLHDVEFAAAAGKTATLEHVGEDWTGTGTRAIGLSGDGRLEANSASGAVAWLAGAYPVDDKTRTLYLGGTNVCAVSRLGNASDGVNGGRLNLVKDGPGTWRLSRNQTLSGTIDVREGTLEAGNDSGDNNYTWFRFVVKSLVASKGIYVSGSEFALYDADGNRQDLGLELVPEFSTLEPNYCDTYYHPSLLSPGQVTCGESGQIYYYKDIRYINRLFDGKANEVIFTTTYRDEHVVNFVYDDPSTWFKMFVLRLPAGANKVVSYDYSSNCKYTDLSGVRTIDSWRLEGSKDGFVWVTLDERDFDKNADACLAQADVWYSDCTANTSAGPRKLSEGKGFGFEMAPPETEEGNYEMFANLSGVKVAPGAKFKRVGDSAVALSALTVDCSAGNGTIEGFDFAENGVIDVVGVADPDSPMHVAIDFVGLPDGALDRVNDRSKWSLTWNGEPSARFRVKVAEKQVSVYPYGTSVIVR